jgi:hypothetical protein
MSSAPLASALTALLAVSAMTTRANADEPRALPSRLPSAVDRALSSPSSLSPGRVEVMSRTGGTALLVVGSVMAGGGWLVSKAGLLIYSQADDAECPGGNDCGLTPTQEAGLGMLIGGAVVCLIGVPLTIYGASVRQRDAPRRGPSRWGTAAVSPQSPLSFTF